MWLRILKVVFHISITALALILIVSMATRQINTLSFDNLESRLNDKIIQNKKDSDEKVRIVQNNLDTYQATREARAQLYAKRLDTLYELYKKDPSVIVNANPTAAQVVANSIEPVQHNFTYLENRTNKVDEKVDSMDNRLSSRLTVLEQRVEVLQNDKKSGSKVIQTNINNNSIGGVTSAR